MTPMLKEIESLHTWDRALDEITEALVDDGQYPREGRPSVRRSELLSEDFQFNAFEDLMLQTNPEALYAEQRRIKDTAEVIIRDRLKEHQYAWIVSDLAGWMEQNANADRWEDNE